MVKKLMVWATVGIVLTMATCVSAEEVYMTKNGKKYHKKICRLVKNKKNIRMLEKEESIEKGYTPCKRCYKEDVKKVLKKGDEKKQVEIEKKN